MNQTDEQTAIHTKLSKGSDWLIINALAGSGKTSTLLSALPIVPQKSIIVTAFNKRIEEEFRSKIPKSPRGSAWATATFHAAGMRIINANVKGKRLELNKNATEELVTEAIDWIQSYEKNFKVTFPIRRAATKLLRLYKETYAMPEITVAHARELGLNYGVLEDLGDAEIDAVAYIVMKAYEMGIRLADRTSIDFCDMIWLPVMNQLACPSRYQAVFVDELQDLSLLQWEMVQRLVAPGGRFVGVGDIHQAIYGWRGAIGVEIYKTLRDRGAAELPLTTTFRCSHAVVKEAQALVPAIKPGPTALPGSVRREDLDTAVAALVEISPMLDLSSDAANWTDTRQTAMVLSRTNAELLRVACLLYRHDVDFDFLGAEEILTPVKVIVDKLDKTTMRRFVANLETWFRIEIARAEKQHAPQLADRLEDYYGILLLMSEFCRSPMEIVKALTDITARQDAPITLSSVHKAKGLEADVVFMMIQTFHRHQVWRKEAPKQEELNLEYVAITRSRNVLVYVDAEPVTSRARR